MSTSVGALLSITDRWPKKDVGVRARLWPTENTHGRSSRRPTPVLVFNLGCRLHFFCFDIKLVMCLSLYECVSSYYIFHRLCLSVGLPSLLITPINCQTSCLGYLNCWENWKMKTSVIYSLTDWQDHLLDCVGQVKNIYCGIWKFTLMLTDLTFEENMIW